MFLGTFVLMVIWIATPFFIYPLIDESKVQPELLDLKDYTLVGFDEDQHVPQFIVFHYSKLAPSVQSEMEWYMSPLQISKTTHIPGE